MARKPPSLYGQRSRVDKMRRIASKPKRRAPPAAPAVPEPAKKREHKFFVFCANTGQLAEGYHAEYAGAMTAAVALLQARANYRYLILEEVNAVYAQAVSVSEDKV